MFGINDQVSLAIINTVDINGNGLSFNLVFPIKHSYYHIPENIFKMSVMEYHHCHNDFGFLVFDIYIGNCDSFESLFMKQVSNGKSVIFKNEESILNLNDNVCYYYDSDGNAVVMNTLNENDIVVKNLDELREVFFEISESFKSLKKEVTNVKKLSYKNKSKN